MITIKCSKWNRMHNMFNMFSTHWCSNCAIFSNGTLLIQCQSVNPWFFHSLTDVDSVDCRRLASNLSTNHRARAGGDPGQGVWAAVWRWAQSGVLTTDQAPQMSDSCTATLIMWYLVCRLQFLRNDPHFTRACSVWDMQCFQALDIELNWSLPYTKWSQKEP